MIRKTTLPSKVLTSGRVVFLHRINILISFEWKEQQTGTEQIKYRYDARGNRIEKSKTGEPVVRYTYNEANQLQGVENGTTQVIVGYDSFGNRTHTNATVDGVVKRSETYLLDPLGDAGEILGWKNELTQERFQFVYGEELLSGSNGSTAWTYQTDRLGSVIGRLDASGILAEELWYEEFGTRTAQNETVTLGPTFGFTGYLYEEDTGLYDARARYYDPELGGFLEEDPEPGRAGDALQRNRYGYCWNNPVRYRDPSGKNEIVVTIQEFLDWIGSGGGAGLTAVLKLQSIIVHTLIEKQIMYIYIGSKISSSMERNSYLSLSNLFWKLVKISIKESCL